MAERKPFLLRIDPGVLEALQRWANDDLRSLNAQIEYLLRQSLNAAGRLRGHPKAARPERDGEGPERSVTDPDERR